MKFEPFHHRNIPEETLALAYGQLLSAFTLFQIADLSTNIETDAASPKKVTTDGVTVEARDISEQIEADQYLASRAAAKGKRRGLVND